MIITAIVVIAVVIITIVVAIVVARRDRGTDAETDDAADERRRGRIVASVMPIVLPTLRLGGRSDRQRRGAQRDSQTSLFQNGLHRLTPVNASNWETPRAPTRVGTGKK